MARAFGAMGYDTEILRYRVREEGDGPLGLKRSGVPFELHVCPFGEHGLSLANDEVAEPEKGRLPDAHMAGWIRECGEWIEQVLP